MKYRLRNLSLVLMFSVLFISGCGKNEKLTVYEEKMSSFFENISELNANMNAVDVSDDVAAQTEILSYLDSLETEFNSLAELEVPEEFISVESLADEAAENMTQAVALYHQLYESETFDTTLSDAANEYYSRANIRLQYIIAILHGEVPEGENVTITMDDDLKMDKETEEATTQETATQEIPIQETSVQE